MGILNIREAVRAGSKVVIGIAGPTGSGKTYTALKIARGMVSNSREVGLLDGENKRGSLYADILDGPFMIGDLYPPFTPARYKEAIKEFQDAGVKVLVIDSASHEWEGEGGCHDIADAFGKKDKNGQINQNWAPAKKEHKKFVNALLQSNMHIIPCIRARDKIDMTDKFNPVKLGLQPICEGNFMFEMTASMMMWNEGKNQQFLKMPEALRPIFGDGSDYLSERHGKALIDWVNTGERVDEELEHWRSQLQMSANDGLDALKAKYLSMPKSLNAKMKAYWPQLEASAVEFDNIKSMEDKPEQAAAAQIVEGEGFNPSKLPAREKPEPQPQADKATPDSTPIEEF